MKRGALLPTLALLLVTASWGSTFPLTKDLVTRIPVVDYLGVRFAIAGAVLCLLAWRTVLRLPRPLFWQAVGLGLTYGIAQIIQTLGLEHTSATVSGFLTGLYVVLTPVLAWAILRTWIGTVTWIAVALAAVGLAILSLNGFSVGLGEGLTIISAVLYALHIVGLGQWSKPEHAIGVSAVQLVVIGLFCLICASFNGITLPSTSHDWTVLIYMALASGLLGMLGQTWAQAHLPATRAAIIMTMEPVFAAIFGVGFGDDEVTLRMGIGCVIVLAAMLLAELGPRTHPEVEVQHLAV